MDEYRVDGMSCAACVAHVEKAVRKLEGVDEVSVSLLTNTMTVSGSASPAKICDAVSAVGYQAKPKTIKAAASAMQDHLKDTETPRLLKRLFASIVFLMPLMYLSMGHMMFGWPLPFFLEGNHLGVGICEMFLSLVVMAVNYRFFTSGVRGVLHGAPNMDTLVAMGSGVSFGYSMYALVAMSYEQSIMRADLAAKYMDQFYFESAAMIVTLITVGKILEAYSKGRTTDALKGLMKLSPQEATVERNGAEIVVPISQVKRGDIYIVHPGESIPVDGLILEGQAAIDTSAMTGESVPRDVTIGEEVIGGTINTTGYLKCEALRVGEDTTLSQIIKMVSDAAATKAPIAKAADKVAAFFVPFVLLVAVATLSAWLYLGAELSFAVTHAIAVLVISCPCALGLATPVAIMVGNGVGAKNGLLFKTATALEQSGKAAIVVLDKTGTITVGHPLVTNVMPNETIALEKMLAVAGMLESKSEHPLARAVMEHIKENKREYYTADSFEVLPGNGIRCKYDGKVYHAGSQAFIYEYLMGTDGEDDFVSFIRSWNISKKEEEGKTAMFFTEDDKLLGAVCVADAMRPTSPDAILALKKLGLRVVMLTGDNERTATAIAKKAGVEAVIAQVMPQAKEKAVRRLQSAGKVIMVGDGINDAPALTSADTGFAIGAGTDIAIDAADVVLTQSRLEDVARAIALSRAVRRNIHQNLFWAFCYNVIGIPLAAGALYPFFGWTLSPMFGAAAMSFSSFCVVINALRLNFIKLDNTRKYKRKRIPINYRQVISGYRRDEAKIKKEEAKRMEKNMTIEGMMCAHCEMNVKKALESIDGVSNAEVSHEKGTAVISFTSNVSNDVLTKAVVDAGYEVKEIA